MTHVDWARSDPDKALMSEESVTVALVRGLMMVRELDEAVISRAIIETYMKEL